MSQHRKKHSRSTFARMQMYSTRDWLAYFCAHLHALYWRKRVWCLCFWEMYHLATSDSCMCVFFLGEHSHDQKVRRMLWTQASVPGGRARHTSGKTRSLHSCYSVASLHICGRWKRRLSSPHPPRILATAERPPGNASVIVTAFPSNDTAPFSINEMGHRKKNTVHHQILSSALQMSLETRSCFITVRLQSSSPLLSLGIWEHCPYAPLTPAAGWVFFLSFFFFFKKRQEQNLSTHDTMPRYSMCCSASMWYTDTLTSSTACWLKKGYK